MESGCVGGDIAIGYVVGFIDAEASFSVSIKYQRGYGLRLDPVFSITQLNREPLDVIHGVINAGRIKETRAETPASLHCRQHQRINRTPNTISRQIPTPPILKRQGLRPI